MLMEPKEAIYDLVKDYTPFAIILYIILKYVNIISYVCFINAASKFSFFSFVFLYIFLFRIESTGIWAILLTIFRNFVTNFLHISIALGIRRPVSIYSRKVWNFISRKVPADAFARIYSDRRVTSYNRRLKEFFNRCRVPTALTKYIHINIYIFCHNSAIVRIAFVKSSQSNQ